MVINNLENLKYATEDTNQFQTFLIFNKNSFNPRSHQYQCFGGKLKKKTTCLLRIPPWTRITDSISINNSLEYSLPQVHGKISIKTISPIIIHYQIKYRSRF